MDLNNLQPKSVGSFVKKDFFLEGKKVKIRSLEERPDNFKEGKTKLVLGVSDSKKNYYLTEISNTNFNQLLTLFGPNFDEDWKDSLVKITSIDEGFKEIEGQQRQCYSLQFEKA